MRRLDLGVSLVGALRLLLLDEPTTGHDPGSHAQVWDHGRAITAAGTPPELKTRTGDDVIDADRNRVWRCW